MVVLAYASDSRALAMLEYLVHIERDDVPNDILAFRTDIPDAETGDLESSRYPPDWNAEPRGTATQRIGDAWIRSRTSLAMRVRSVVVEEQANVLVDPLHERFAEIVFADPYSCRFDARLTS